MSYKVIQPVLLHHFFSQHFQVLGSKTLKNRFLNATCARLLFMVMTNIFVLTFPRFSVNCFSATAPLFRPNRAISAGVVVYEPCLPAWQSPICPPGADCVHTCVYVYVYAGNERDD